MDKNYEQNVLNKPMFFSFNKKKKQQQNIIVNMFIFGIKLIKWKENKIFQINHFKEL